MHKLYYSPGSCALAPHILLEEIGIPYELHLVSTQDGSTAKPEWKAINPKGRVPALTGVPGRIGGTENLLTEASAIMIYLARSHPEARLLPADPAQEARCIEWMNYIATSVHAQAVSQVWRTHRFVEHEKDYSTVQAKGRATVLEQFAYIESLMADGRNWAVPGGYTMADAYLLVIYRWGYRLGYDMKDYPAWSKIMDKVLARPAVQRALAQEGITIPP